MPSYVCNELKVRTVQKNEMPYMKYLIDGIPPELIKKAKKELGETEEVKAECLKELRSLIKSVPDFNPCMDDVFLLRFLRAKKYRVDKAFTTLKNYYAYKATYSGILTDFLPSHIKEIAKMAFGTALEYRDSTHAGIGVLCLGKLDLHKITPDEMLAAILVCAELGMNMESIAISGYAIILDFAGVSLHTLKRFATPTFLYRLITVIQDVIPCRIKGYHIVNQPYFFHIALSIAKTLISEKLSDRLHLHGSNMKSLYKHIPQEILPEELGGKQGPLCKYLNNVFLKKLFTMEDHYIRLRKYGYEGKTLMQLQKDNPHPIIT